MRAFFAMGSLTTRIVLAIVCALGPRLAAAAPAGSVDFAVGRVEARGPDGTGRLLGRGAEIAAGDTISTYDGRAQLRFTDGGFVSLAPNSEFGIRDYAYDGRNDGTERGFFSLLKGAMRTVTGAVGRVNRDAYQLHTPTATIGIRGTGGVIAIGPDGSTRITGTSGVWVLTTRGGSIEVPAGFSGYAPPDPNVAPQRIAHSALIPPTPYGALPSLPAFSIDQARRQDGLPAVVERPEPQPQPRLVSAPVFPDTTPATFTGLAYVFVHPDPGSPIARQGNQGVPDPGWPEQQRFDLDPTGKIAINGVSAKTVDAGTDGLSSWARWIGNVELTGTGVRKFSENGGVHGVYGVPTPLAEMPRGEATYRFSGGTQPTLGNELAAPGRFVGGDMRVDFDRQRVGLDFGVTFDALKQSWRVTTTGGVKDVLGSEVRIDGSTFGGAIPGVSSTGGSTAGCTDRGCVASVAGGFVGKGAAGAAFGYRIDNVLIPVPGVSGAPMPTSINGTAAFRQGAPAIDTQTLKVPR